MALVLKIAIASAILAAAFVYGTEHEAAGAKTAGRVSLGEPARAEPAVATPGSGPGIRVIALTPPRPA